MHAPRERQRTERERRMRETRVRESAVGGRKGKGIIETCLGEKAPSLACTCVVMTLLPDCQMTIKSDELIKFTTLRKNLRSLMPFIKYVLSRLRPVYTFVKDGPILRRFKIWILTGGKGSNKSGTIL